MKNAIKYAGKMSGDTLPHEKGPEILRMLGVEELLAARQGQVPA